jgi:N-acetylglucosamine-6-sulfatase
MTFLERLRRRDRERDRSGTGRTGRALGRRLAVVGAIAGLTATGIGSAGGHTSSPDNPRPNVITIMTDDQDAASLAAMPNVRRLLAEPGTTFVNSFVSYPLCCPSRATYLTGQYPHNHGVWSNIPPNGGYYQLRGEETLPVWLSRAGYQTAHIGKYLNQYGTRNPREVPAGWQEWYGSVDPSTYRMWGYTLNENGQLKTYGQRDVEDPALYQTDVYARKAVDYVHRKAPGDAPFFLSLAPLAIHFEAGRAGDEPSPDERDPRPAPRHRGAFADAPLPRPPSFNEADVSDKPRHIQELPRLDEAAVDQITLRHRSRLESLLAVDEAVAALVAALEAHQELANTLIIFTSDNGWMQGEHRIERGKVHPYEESARVPLVLRGPGIPAGTRSEVMVGNVDLAPTILDAAGAAAGIPLDGRSLLGAGPPRPDGRALLIETGPGRPGPWYSAIRTDRFLYVEHSSGERELYDLPRDPYQLASRHADPAYQQQVVALAGQLQRLRRCAGRTCP